MKLSELEQFKSLFPLTANITQEMIDTASMYHPNKCIGAKALKEVLPNELKYKASWGANNSVINIGSQKVYLITIENVNMMKVTEPMQVTFILDERYN